MAGRAPFTRSVLARTRAGVAVGVGLLGAVVLGLPVFAQEIPPISSTTSTTVAPTTSTTSASGFDDGSSTPAPAGQRQEGDGGAPTDGSIPIPPGAAEVINSVRRTGSNSSVRLLAAVKKLEAVGLSHDEAIRVGFGRFPVAGEARYSHDWLLPRYGPGFRFHLGCDLVAAYGTPLRAPVDGVATTSTSELGGLSVKVHMPDGTFFYLAHLSALVENFQDGMAVRTGDIVGYVGDSGNARGTPHLHFAIHPYGGPPTDPKPVLDQFLAEAEARIPELVDHYRREQPRPVPTAPDAGPRVTLATLLVQPLAAIGDPVALPTELLFATSANPAGGSVHIAGAAARSIVDGIDWHTREQLTLGRLAAARERELMAVALLAPLLGEEEALLRALTAG